MAWLHLFSRRAAAPPPAPELRALRLADDASVAVRWVRDARARRLRLIVNEKGVRLTLPVRASVALAEQFLLEHRGWLQEQLARRPAATPLPLFTRLERSLPLRGLLLDIDWREGRYCRVEGSENGVRIQLAARTSDGQLRAALRDFYTGEARADVGRWLSAYLPQLPRAPTALRYRSMSSLWGSLAPNDVVSLDLSLVLGPPAAFEYVLVHELCHLIHRDHSRRYWREVEARCPDWRRQRDFLHGQGLALKAQMRRFSAG